MRTREEIRALAQDNYADYMMGDPFSDEAVSDYERSLEELTPDERRTYREVSKELADERAAKRG